MLHRRRDQDVAQPAPHVAEITRSPRPSPRLLPTLSKQPEHLRSVPLAKRSGKEPQESPIDASSHPARSSPTQEGTGSGRTDLSFEARRLGRGDPAAELREFVVAAPLIVALSPLALHLREQPAVRQSREGAVEAARMGLDAAVRALPNRP